ncbi:MAG TPA: nuclear transport factor 2 family protein [Haliangium sp.]|nr:nuclear transport factor 2 family protein [Haliangium sp.]
MSNLGVLRVLTAAALALACAAGACGGSPEPPATPPRAAAPVSTLSGDAAEAARAVLEQYRQAHEVRSVEALDPLYLAAPELSRVWQGQRTAGWDTTRAELAALFNRARSIKLRVDQVAVHELGPGGVAVVADVSRTVSDGVTSVRVDGVLTLVLRRQDERWQIVSEHFSYPLTPP